MFVSVHVEDFKEERERANKGLSFDEESSLAAFASISLRRDRGRRYYWDLGFLRRQGRRVCFVWGNCKRVSVIFFISQISTSIIMLS